MLLTILERGVHRSDGGMVSHHILRKVGNRSTRADSHIIGGFNWCAPSEGEAAKPGLGVVASFGTRAFECQKLR